MDTKDAYLEQKRLALYNEVGQVLFGDAYAEAKRTASPIDFLVRAYDTRIEQVLSAVAGHAAWMSLPALPERFHEDETGDMTAATAYFQGAGDMLSGIMRLVSPDA